MQRGSGVDGPVGTFIFVTVILIFGAAGEEILFRGYGFQVLLRSIGPYATILPVGVLFGALHASNPHVTNLGLVNTAVCVHTLPRCDPRPLIASLVLVPSPIQHWKTHRWSCLSYAAWRSLLRPAPF